MFSIHTIKTNTFNCAFPFVGEIHSIIINNDIMFPYCVAITLYHIAYCGTFSLHARHSPIVHRNDFFILALEWLGLVVG